MAILKLREDNRAVFNKLQEFRKKYNELVQNKAQLQEILIGAEQEKLKISKALVDLQIENNELVERSENDKYELVTKLLNAENEIMESERKEQKKISNVEDLKATITKLAKEKKELALEFIVSIFSSFWTILFILLTTLTTVFNIVYFSLQFL